MALARRLNAADNIFWVGQLSSRELSAYFRQATAFIQISRAESFSFIQVEALGNGCVCVSCDKPPMPEILGESALYYRTGDAHDLAAKMTTILRMSNEDRTRFQELSKKTAGQFSWDETAVELLSRWKMRYVVSDT